MPKRHNIDKYSTEERNKERKLKDLSATTNGDEMRLDEEAVSPDTTVFMENPFSVIQPFKQCFHNNIDGVLAIINIQANINSYSG